MSTTIFEKDGFQNVLLPEEFKFSTDEVLINKIGETIIIMPKNVKWDSFFHAIDSFSDDFMKDGRSPQTITEG